MVDPEVVLVVDDSPANLTVVGEMLGNAGYEVRTAISGERALKQVSLSPDDGVASEISSPEASAPDLSLPDLILLDVQMTGIDGFETCRQLKANPATASIPVIFMTAATDPDSTVQGFASGAVDYIPKPFPEQELLARVKTHLQLRQLTRHLEQRVAEQTANLEAALTQLQESQLQLVHTEKMSTLGNLVAGVAHEVNNPIVFISGNIRPAQEYVDSLFQLLDAYQQELPQPSAALQQLIKAIDLPYVREDLPKLIGSMKQGVDRIYTISNSLRTFSRADHDRLLPYNIHDGLDSTLLILKHRLKGNETRPEIQVIKDYGDLPEVECFAGQLNQVFMNILANAIDALDEQNQGRSFAHIEAHPNQITVRTGWGEKGVEIAIADNGQGISPEVQGRIFDQFFTTKNPGKGTGLGLAIAHQIVVEKHGGTLTVQSTPGQGTEFLVSIPNP